MDNSVSETGGSAKWANFFAPLLSEAMPGNPNVVVKFMPGAGSTKGANWFQNQKHSDGTVMFGSPGRHSSRICWVTRVFVTNTVTGILSWRPVQVVLPT